MSRVLVGGAGEEGRVRDLGLTCKIIFFLIKMKKIRLRSRG